MQRGCVISGAVVEDQEGAWVNTVLPAQIVCCKLYFKYYMKLLVLLQLWAVGVFDNQPEKPAVISLMREHLQSLRGRTDAP